MARLAAQARAYYYPTPGSEVAVLTSLVRPPARTSQYYPVVVTDPCAGRGELLIPFVRTLSESVQIHPRAVELDHARYEDLVDAVPTSARKEILWGDARRVYTGDGSIGLLLLNPPYDLGALEEEWYSRWMPRLSVGGVLIFIIPQSAVRRVAESVATHFDEVRYARFSDTEFGAYRQVVIIARKRYSLPSPDPHIIDLLSTPVEEMVVLGTAGIEPVEMTSTGLSNSSWRVENLDSGLAESYQSAWIADTRSGRPEPVFGSLGCYDSIEDVIRDVSSPTTCVAIPPSPAHMATLLASGLLDGAVISPDDPSLGLPDVAMRGTYEREWSVVEERFSKTGAKTAEIEQQTPALSVSVIDLETGRLWELIQSAEPSFDRKRYDWLVAHPEEWADASECRGVPLESPLQICSTGDLLTMYSVSARRTIQKRCISIFDPDTDDEPIPGIDHWPRTPFAAQAVRIKAALRLIRETGVHPLIQGQTGTGKTTVAAMTATGWILGRPTCGIQRVLVIAPSHLVPVWREEQIPEILGTDVEVVDLDSITAVDHWMRDDREFDGTPVGGVRISFGILSRSKAKLGYLIDGINGVVRPVSRDTDGEVLWVEHCPDCGTPLDSTLSKKSRGSRRARCGAIVRGAPNDSWSAISRPLIRILDDARSGKGVPRGVLDARLESVVAALVGEELDDRGERASVLEAMVLSLSAQSSRIDGARLLFERGLEMDDYSLTASGLRLVMCEDDSSDVVEEMKADAARRGLEVPYVYTPYDQKIAGAAPGSRDAIHLLTKRLEKTVGFQTRVCGAPHYTASVERGEGYRRYPLARYIYRRYRNQVRFAISDEAHEAANCDSAQSLADQYLYQLGCPVIRMTGTSSNGYPSSMSVGLWYGGGPYRDDFGPRDHQVFQRVHGYNRRKVELINECDQRVEYGSTSNARTKRTPMGSPAPGISPGAVTRYILPTSIPLSLQDLDCDLPPHTESTVFVEPLPEQKRAYDEIISTLRATCIRDRFTPRAGSLMGALNHAPSCLDLNLKMSGNNPDGGYLVAYPERFDGEVVCRHPGLDGGLVLPKEARLRDICLENRESGRRTLVGVWYSGFGAVESLPERLLRILREAGLRVAHLEPARVAPKRRLAWIEKNCIRAGCDVLITQPRAVETGLNNLVYFSTGVLYDTCPYPTTYDQFSGRLHRPGQTRPTRIVSLVYEGTAQVVAHDHQMRKVAVVRATDGMDPRTALRSVGADGGAVDYSMSLAEMILRADC